MLQKSKFKLFNKQFMSKNRHTLCRLYHLRVIYLKEKIMKRGIATKVVILTLGLTLLNGVLFAGGQAGKGVAASSAKVYQRDPNLNPPGTFPINKQKVALRFGVEQSGMIENWETNWMTRHIEEKGNYDLSFEVYPTGEMNQKLELMVMAGGADLPDVLITGSAGFNLAAITKYGQAGMIIPTNIYYQNSAYFINQVKKDLSFDPVKYVTSYDGNIYGMYFAGSAANSEHSAGRIMIYEPWLQKLGLKKPETVDEFLNVLRAFRDRDPNDNGQKDEIPLVAYRDMMAGQYLNALMMPFIYTQPNFWILNSGKIDVSFDKSGWRDGIRYTKQLIDEGLLSPLSFTQDQTQMTALITPDPPKAGAFVRYSSSNLGANDKKRTEYVIVTPLEGPAGKNALWWPQLPTITLLITKNCKNPESAFMLGDYLGSDEMNLTTRYGEKGVDWVEPGLEERKSIIDGVSIWVKPINLIWGVMQNKHWISTGPRLITNKYTFTDIAGADPNNPYDYTVPIAKHILTEIKYETKTPITGLIYNEQEQEIMNEFHSTILTYVHESYARFVMGDLSIDRDWNSYVAEFDKMGLKEVIAATQSAWDRMNK
jgi:putative aldouronate transport system substrate-binding protein